MSGQEVGSSAGEATGSARDMEQVGFVSRLPDGDESSLGFGCVRIGRQRRADLVIEEKTVSRHHADICYESGRYVLYDHSSNGTWVNGTLVVVAQPLRNGDTVRFGEAEFRFSLKTVPRQQAVASTARDTPTGVGKRSTLMMKGGKGRRKTGRGKLLLWLVLAALLIGAAVVYFFFPGVIGQGSP
ncbi:MAG: FHA domain-containing protein [Gemmatimonadales bacterium]|jgi:predicted component of type VI protein secretion system